MHPRAETLRRLGIDGALSHDAPERGLNVRTWAAETVVKVEMPEGGIEVVAPEEADDATAEPDAFRIAGRAVDQARGFREFVGLTLILGGIGGLSGLRRLVAGLGLVALGGGRKRRQCKKRCRECRRQNTQEQGHGAPVMVGPRTSRPVESSVYIDWVVIAAWGRSDPNCRRIAEYRRVLSSGRGDCA
jgi:hypothetical protein